MKAIIPVAGAGTRLRPHTYTQPKPLLPVAGKPIISFIIESLLASGIQEFVFVTGYLSEKIERFIDQEFPNINKTFVFQEDREGIGHAIWTARHTIEHCEEVFIVLGDIIFDADLRKMMSSRNSCIGVRQVNEPREFGVVELNSEKYIKRVEEKPKIPMSDLAIVGLYYIKEVKLLIECLEKNIENNHRTNGEFQLTDGLMSMIQKGVHFSTYKVEKWFDCGRKGILLETNAMLLSKYPSQKSFVGFGNSVIIPPVSIGENCEIKDSIIGPFVSVGDSSNIKNSIVKNSIIGTYTSLDEVILDYSVIGNDTSIKGLKQSLNIGDNTEIDFS